MEPDVASLAESPFDPPRPTSAITSPSSPKSQVFEWCARYKVAPPAFEIAAVPQGFEGWAALKLPDGTILTTSDHTERAKKPLEHALCGELFAALERLLGPERVPPRPPPRRRPKAKAPPALQESPAEAAARTKAQAKEQAARERHEALRQLLGTVTKDNVRETFAVLKARTYVRSVRIRVAQQRGGTLQMEAQCVRPDGSTLHLMPFWTANKAEGETLAMAQMLESIATSIGMRMLVSR